MAVLVVGIALTSASVHADVVIDFDDLSGGNSDTPLPVGYAGLSWDPEWFHWEYEQDPFNPSSLYQRVATHNYGGWIDFSPLGEPVDFKGAFFSGLDVATIHFEGYLNGAHVGTSASLSPSSTPTFLSANFGGWVDRVEVVCATWNYFAMDDLTYARIPEPAAVVLGFIGLGVIGWVKRRLV